MKKGMIVLIILIIMLIIFNILKDKNKIKYKENINNPYNTFIFYKEENLERYKEYQNKNKIDIKNTILRVNIGLDNSFYTNTKEINKFNKLMLINKYNYVNKDFKVDNLVLVKEFAINNMYLEEECMNSFIKMAKEAYYEGFNIRAISTYRTYEYQENLYNNYVKIDGIQKADTYSARPGFSEHHTGLAVDVDNINTNFNNFENTKEFTWLSKNSYKYGFILRYPKDKENITGYIYEPWHYRYIGSEIATYIYKNNITFDEYYYEFLDK